MNFTTCGVCYESTSDTILCTRVDSLDESDSKSHKYCFDCTKQYAEVATFSQPLSPKNMGFSCMEPYCDGTILYESCATLINETTKEHFLERYKRESEPKEKNKDEQMMAEIEALQNQIANSSIMTCQSCGIQYFKEQGCNVVKCRCGQKQCALCAKPFSSKWSNVHFNENTIEYHVLTCKNKTLSDLNKDIDELSNRYSLSKEDIVTHFPHRKTTFYTVLRDRLTWLVPYLAIIGRYILLLRIILTVILLLVQVFYENVQHGAEICVFENDTQCYAPDFLYRGKFFYNNTNMYENYLSEQLDNWEFMHLVFDIVYHFFIL